MRLILILLNSVILHDKYRENIFKVNSAETQVNWAAKRKDIKFLIMPSD